jgi:hypothetical protein
MVANTRESYNYDRYKMSNYDAGAFDGPKAGEPALWDFELADLQGNAVKLADYRGKWVVLETGSLTCGMYVKNLHREYGVAQLVEQYPDVEFLTIYVREAHPGSRQGPCSSAEDKIRLARRTKEEYADPRTFLVDTVDGEMHRAYGSWPNMVYVIDPRGQVIYRCDWAFPNLIRDALEARDSIHTREHQPIITAPLHIMVPVVLRGGWDALWDLVIALPVLTFKHLQQDLRAFFERRAKRQSQTTV